MAKPKFIADPEIGRQNVRDALARLEKFTAGLTKPEAFKGALRRGSKGNLHRYSLRNQALMLLHRADADHIGTAHYWFAHGRVPVKGAGTHLLMPRQFVRREDVDEDTPGAIIDETGQAYIEKMVRFFKAVMYWDIRDTTDRKGNPYTPPAPQPVAPGRPSRTPINPNFDLSDDQIERSTEIEAEARAFAIARNCQVVDAKVKGAYGAFFPHLRLISIDPDQNPLKRCGTVVHEVAHLLEVDLGTRDGYDLGEIVAEGAAFVVLSRYDLDTSAFSFGYIERYGADLATFRKALSAIQLISNALIAGIEHEGEVAEDAA